MPDPYARFASLKIDWIESRILRVTFDGSDQWNTLTSDMHRDLAEIWREIDSDARVRAVILRGDGPNFSAGGDFSVVEGMINDPDMRNRVWKEARDLVYNMINCSKPIVSSMQGAVVGGALAAGLLADISIATKTARLIDGHIRLGVAAGDHAVLLWPLLCGLAKAKYHLFLNEPVSGENAEKMGLVSLAVDEAELEATTLLIAKRLADGPPNALRLTKYALNNWLRSAGPTFDASLAFEMLGFASDEAREGFAAVKEKRKPVFDGNLPTTDK